ncbi:MAG: tetratricopeptide repeat protein [Burkholderiales bacterium]
MRIHVWLFAACLSLVAAPGWCAGGGGGGGGGSDSAEADPDYQAGLAAVKSNDWPQVITRMSAVTQRDPKNANAWNELGHAYRKAGDMDNSFKHYERALQIDPKHKGAHEYLGEAYLQIGKPEMAEQELKALDKICFITCEEYRDLKAQIERYKRERTKAASIT